MKKQSKGKEETKVAANPKFEPQSIYTAPWALVVFTMGASVAIFYNNPFPIILLYFSLLFLGVGVILRLEILLGSILGLIFISIWIVAKVLSGVWIMDRIVSNLVEVVGVGLTFIASSMYHRQAKKIVILYNENQRRIKSLDLEDRSVGLLKSKVGLLRLNEEEERSSRYQRPLTLMLIQVRPIPGIVWGPTDATGLLHTLADTIKAKTRDVDIPFLLSQDRIALILPETEASGAKKVVNNIVNSMMNVRYLPYTGSPVFMWEYGQIRFGFATFLGKSSARVQMLEAAERSLNRNLKINPEDLYQNVFLEWETIGEAPSPVQVVSVGGEEALIPDEAVVPLDKPVLSGPNRNDKKNLVIRMIERLRSL